MHFKALSSLFFLTLLILAPSPVLARTINIVGFGDSLMAGYELPADQAFPARLQKLLSERGHDVVIANAGVSGDTTGDGLARLDWSIPDGTDAVILELGANDALRGLSPEESKQNLVAIINRLQERGIEILLVGMMAPPNMGAAYEAAFNPIFPELAATFALDFYPFFLDGVALDPDLKHKDGMHPNGRGTTIMAERIAPAVEQLLGRIIKKQ